MFLLIPVTPHTYNNKDLIYIPLCFYLYTANAPLAYQVSIFTFHYVSTYTNWCSSWPLHTVHIYIPLCFYLYQFIKRVKRNIFRIYIPLCFYLYRVLRFNTVWIERIYIPLCFYLYRDLAANNSWNIWIYIPLCFYLYSSVLLCAFYGF